MSLSSCYGPAISTPRKPRRRVGRLKMTSAERQRFRDLEVVRLRDLLRLAWAEIAAAVDRSESQCRRRYMIAKQHLGRHG